MSQKVIGDSNAASRRAFQFQALLMVGICVLFCNQIQAQITLDEVYEKYKTNNAKLLSKPVAIHWTKNEAVTPEYVKAITPHIAKIEKLKKELKDENAIARADQFLRLYRLAHLQVKFNNHLLQSCDKGVVYGRSRDGDAFFDSQMNLVDINQDFEMNVNILPRTEEMYAGLGYYENGKSRTIELEASTVRSIKTRLGVGNVDGVVTDLGPGLDEYSKSFSNWTALLFPNDFDVKKLDNVRVVQDKEIVKLSFYTPVTDVGLGTKRGDWVTAEVDLSKGAMPTKFCRTRFSEKDGKRYDAFAKSFTTEEYNFEIGAHDGAFYIKHAKYDHWRPKALISWETVRSRIVGEPKWRNLTVALTSTAMAKNAEKIEWRSFEIKTREVSTWKPKDIDRLFNVDKIPQSKRVHRDFRDIYPPKK